MISNIVTAIYLGAATAADIQKQRLSIALLALSVVPIAVSLILNRELSMGSRLWGVALGGAGIAFTLLTKGGVGLGDSIMFVILGAICGVGESVAIMGISLLLAGIYSGIMMVLKKLGPKNRIPFIPFIFAAYGVTALLPVLIG